MTCESFLKCLYEKFNNTVTENPLEFTDCKIELQDDRFIFKKFFTINDKQKVDAVSCVMADLYNVRFWIRIFGFPVLRGSRQYFLWTSYRLDLDLNTAQSSSISLMNLFRLKSKYELDNYINDMCKTLYNVLEFEFVENTLSIPLFKYDH